MIKNIIKIAIIAFKKCCPLKVTGELAIKSWSFKNAIIEPENVIAPIEAPSDISIKLAILMLPTDPKLNVSGFRKAEMATNTAAKPIRLWNPATSCGIAVIETLNAIKLPINPPIIKKTKI